MSMTSRVIVYGGKGALGATCVSLFKQHNIWVCSIDMNPNEEADANIIVTEMSDWEKQHSEVHAHVAEVLNGEKVDGVFNVAGGWAGGGAASKVLVKNSDLMWKQSVWSSTISASLAATFLNNGGVITLPGALPAESGTPGMMGYGMAKAAVHQLTKSLGSEGSGLPDGATALCILPVTLDTPMNRKWMPKADTTTWTTLEFVGELFYGWLTGGVERPTSGSLVKMMTENSVTTTEVV